MAMIKKQFNNKKQNFQRKKGGDFKKKPFGRRPEGRPVVQTAENFKNFEGVFKQSGKKNTIMTKNLTPGLSVYDEKRVSFGEGEERTEYRIWNPFRSKLGAGIVAGCNKIAIRPGSKVLYLGAASGTTVSHVSDIVGENGTVFAVEFSQRSGRDLVTLAQRRRNIIPIIEDARQPSKYRMLVQMCDVIFSDVAQPDQVRIVGLNAKFFLKAGGIVMISIKANCVDSTKAPQAVFAQEVNNCKKENITPKEQVSLEPFEKDHAMIVGSFSPN